MRATIVCLTALALSCARTPSSGPADQAADAASAVTTTTATGAAPDRRCLPLVLNDACVMPCTAGTRDDAGTYRLEFWGRTPVQVQKRCDDGGCSDTFNATTRMGGACLARPLDTRCHFEGSACLGGAPSENWPPAP